MLFIIILSVFASLSFRRVMQEKGYENSRAWMFPGFVGCSVIVFSALLKRIAGWIIGDESSVLLAAYPAILGVFAVLIHSLIIAKMWKQIKKLPSVEASDTSQ